MKKTLLSLTTAAIVAGSALLASPAGAIDHRGVKTLTYHESTETCLTGQALPCTTNAGHGDANVLRIDQRIANGMNEAEARSIPFAYDTWVITHAEVRCSGENRTFVKKMPRYLPLRIEFVPVAQPTVRGRVAGHGDLTFQGTDTGTNG